PGRGGARKMAWLLHVEPDTLEIPFATLGDARLCPGFDYWAERVKLREVKQRDHAKVFEKRPRRVVEGLVRGSREQVHGFGEVKKGCEIGQRRRRLQGTRPDADQAQIRSRGSR